MFSHLNEPTILKGLNRYSFGIKLIASFKDYDNIYLVTTFFEGKTLENFKDKIMNEDEIKFISACVILSFIYFRKQKIIHRDINFQNIIMDSDNYFNIIDFSSSINYANKDNKDYYIKTAPYVAPPEMLSKKIYYYNSDYYRLGSLIYYLMFKKYPNIIKKENKIKHIKIDYKKIRNYSSTSIDFLNKLILTNPKQRIGYEDINEMKNHFWFNDIDWNNLEKKQIKSPFHFEKNSNNSSKCSEFKLSKKLIQTYRKTSKTTIFKELINNFDYTNKSILRFNYM